MPEGDVLRRTAFRLDQALAGRRLLVADLRWPNVAGVDLTGRTVLGTAPYGKHLLTRLDDGRTLHTHLRMDGLWRIERTGPAADTESRSARVRVVLGADTWTALGLLLGMVDVVATRDEARLVGHLGPDLLAEPFDVTEAVRRWAARGSTPVAEVLLDQRVVAGIGTIYSAESLFVHRLWPWTPADEVTDPARLLATARRLMQRSVVAGPQPTKVHGRLRAPCRRCGTPVVVGQARRPPMERPVFYCPRCQAAPRPSAPR